jgi:hypothetical protein
MQNLTDQEFIKAWHDAGGSPAKVSKLTGVDIRTIYRRRDKLMGRGVILETTKADGTMNNRAIEYIKRAPVNIDSGAIVIFSDAHWWPKQSMTVSNHALLKVIDAINPKVVIANGDILDGASISRHDPEGWREVPPLHAELDCVKQRMAEIADAAGDATLLRTIGNHDIRFDKRLALQAPDYRHLAGMMLRHHLEDWQESMSVEINSSVIIKHRWHNGIHGAYNNVLRAGRSIVTGHLHRLQVTPWADYNGRRFGIDCGTLADIGGPQFDYDEDSPKNWGQGFVVLTFHKGQLLPPEICEVLGGKAFFRGSLVYEQKDSKPNKRTGKTPARTRSKARD